MNLVKKATLAFLYRKQLKNRVNETKPKFIKVYRAEFSHALREVQLDHA